VIDQVLNLVEEMLVLRHEALLRCQNLLRLGQAFVLGFL
jgi:hypothetical protein